MIWRMLRLEENIQPFLRVARHSEHLDTTTRVGARLIRGTCLYEDVLCATLALRTSEDTVNWALVAGIVDRLGHPLASNPTLRAFPSPQRVLEGDALLEGLLPPSLKSRAQGVARVFRDQADEVEALAQRLWSTDELADALSPLLQLEAESLGLLMLSLGRYDYVPNDALALRRMRWYNGPEAENDPEAARRFFARWQPWGGLAYWLWDWQRISTRASLVMRAP